MAATLLLGAGLLHLLPRLGSTGRAISAKLARAPGLDLVVTYFTAAPLIVGPILGGWIGLAAAIVAQVLTIVLWTALHELAHRRVRQSPRIVTVLNQAVGRWRNHAALWIMAPAAPMFWLVRMTELLVYPPLTWLVGLPRYPAGEWVNVSRQKFDGLVGHDLIWCLYCDWMTGIWSLGSEMLRNIESMWCPIRFADGKKCDNCRIDFPDVDRWTPADGHIADVAGLLEQQYLESDHRGWFGHRARLTLNGEPIQNH